MFGWLFGKKLNVYSPKKRLIYHYWNGKEQIHADPLVLYRNMMEEGPSLSIDIKVATSPSKDASKAHGSMINRIRKIFDLKDFSDGGLTEAEAMDLFDHFLNWCDDLKKNSKTSQTTSTCTEECKTISKESPAIPNTSDSGLTEKESVTEGAVL